MRRTQILVLAALIAMVCGGAIALTIFSIQKQVALNARNAIHDEHISYVGGYQKHSKRPGQESDTGYVTIKAKDATALKTLLEREGILFEDIAPLGLIRLQEEDLKKLDQTTKDGVIAHVQPEVVYSIMRIPNDTRYTSQSYLGNLQAPEAWDLQTGLSSVKIAVVDTGILGTHEDLSSKMVAGYDYVRNRALTGGENSDDQGHGTIIAGIIAAASNNAKGIAGIDWAAKLMPIKVIRSDGTGVDTDIASGIRYAVDNGASVINMSFGGGFSQTLKDQIDYAWSRGVLMVAAVGNSGSETTLYPAGWDEVLAVGSVSSNQKRSTFSNYGGFIDVMAFGESILSTNYFGGYSTATGTSVATPFVTGALALIKGQQPSISKTAAYSAVRNAAKDIDESGNDKYTGAGLLQLKSALQNGSSFQYSHIAQNSHPEIAPGSSYTFSLIIKNTGQSTWQRSIVNLGTDRSQDRIPGFIRECTGGNASGWISGNRIQMQESSVAPGNTATFNFCMKAPSNMQPGTYREYFRPVTDSIGWMEDLGIYWDVKVLSPAEQYKYTWVGQSGHPTLSRNQANQFSLTLRNTGTATWTRSVVSLGTSRNQDRIPVFTREGSGVSGWISGNRIQMQESSVAPGNTATFVFWMRNDGVSSGTYREYFQPVADNITWLADTGIYWEITVP